MDDAVAQVDALVADVNGRPGNQLIDLVLVLAAKAATEPPRHAVPLMPRGGAAAAGRISDRMLANAPMSTPHIARPGSPPRARGGAAAVLASALAADCGGKGRTVRPHDATRR